jgi:hypothetical protein
VLEQRRGDVLDERDVGYGLDVRFLGVCRWRLHRSVYAGSEAVLEQRCADVLGERTMGRGNLYESNLRRGGLHGSVCARDEAVQQPDAAEL